MNSQKIDCQERIQQTHGLISDFDSQFANQSSQYLGNQQNWNMGIGMHPLGTQAGTQQQGLGPSKQSSAIIGRFESPASAFYATERYMGFSPYECQVGNPSCYSRTNDSQFSSYQSPGENFSIESEEQAEPNFELRNCALQPMLKTQLCGNQIYRSPEKLHKIPGSNFPGSKLPSHEQNKLLSDNRLQVGRHFSIPYDENQDRRIPCDSYSSPHAQMSFAFQQQKQSPRISSGGVSVSSGNPISTGPVLSSKTRIRWTQDLHEKFVECVNCLGGAEKATPKAILKLMDSYGLTIFHVKSHLQKYRIAKYMPDSIEGKSDKRAFIMNDVPHIDVKTGLQIKEALQVQLDVQRRLHEQLEIQRNLQLRIEEQGKQLKMMFDQQQKNTNTLLRSQNLQATFSSNAPFSSENVEVSTVEGSDNNTHFPSKIS